MKKWNQRGNQTMQINQNIIYKYTLKYHKLINVFHFLSHFTFVSLY